MNKKVKRLKQSENLSGWAFIAPCFIVFISLTAIPFLLSLILSLVDWNFFGGWSKLKFVGLNNFVALLSDKNYLNALKNTFIYVVTIVPLSIVLSVVLAYCMNGRIFGKRLLRMAFFVPYICSIVAVGTVFKFLFRDDGIVNNLLINAHLIDEPIRWIIDARFSKIPIILLSTWTALGYQLVLLTAAMQNVPTSLYEAAKIDGSSSATQFFKITLPMISPTIFFLVITRIMGVFKIFSSVNIFTIGTTVQSTRSVVQEVYETAFTKFEFGYASAMSVVLFLIIMLVTVLNFKFQDKWVFY